jgi:type II secretory pathway pseudopilin PulG
MIMKIGNNEMQRSSRNAAAGAFTLIQLIGTLALIAMLISIILISIKTVSDRAQDASNARRQGLAPALDAIRDATATGVVSNHNASARQADQALNLIK